MAWPEKLILIFLGAIALFAAEIGVLLSLRGSPSWFVALYFIGSLAADLWGAFRVVDWLWAGPARRKRDKVVRFNP